MQATTQFIKKLADGTVRFILRLEGEEFDQPVHVQGSAWNGDVFLVERLQPAPITREIPAVSPV